ncbi:MAG: hypothetical protein AAGD22_01775 [Verrucomicrobiota bacterium]
MRKPIHMILNLGTGCRDLAALVWRHHFLAVAMILVWLVSIDLKPNIPTPDLDPSWGAILEANARHGTQFGTESIHTYGPLGYLYNSTFSIKFFERQLSTEFFLKGIAAFAIFLLGTRLPPIGRITLVASLLLVPADTFQIAAMSLPLMIVTSTQRAQIPLALFSLLLLIPLAMMKFTLTVVIIYVTMVAAILLVFSGRWRFALAWLAVALVAFLVTWKQIGQSNWNLPDFFVNSMSIATGYAAGMGRQADPASLLVGLVSATALVLLISLPLLPALKQKEWLTLVKTGLAISIPAAFAFIVWKHGFTRADPGHISIFFAFTPFVALTCLACFDLPPITEKCRHLLTVVVIVSAALGLTITDKNASFSIRNPIAALGTRLECLADLKEYQEDKKREYKAAQKDADLPRIRSVINEDSVDVFGNQQGYAILNDFKLKHRPVFQSYNAYTPLLLDLNEEFYLSDQRPQYVMLNLDSFDYRFPPNDDSKALALILANYRPLFVEEEHLLLVQTDTLTQWEPELVEERAITLGSPIDLTAYVDRNLWLEIEVHPSLKGRLIGFLYRSPHVFITLDETNVPLDHIQYLLSRKAASAGFIASPLLLHRDDVARLYRGEQPIRPKQISVDVAPEHRSLYKTTAELRVFELPSPLVPDKWSGPDADTAVLSPLGPDGANAEVRAPTSPQRTQIDNRTALVVPAPGEVRLPIPDKATRLTGFFGISKGAYKWNRESDGVSFKIEQHDANSTQKVVLLEEHLDPLENSSDRLPVDFDIPLAKAAEGKTIVLTTRPGKSGNAQWDTGAWGDLRFQ